MSQPSSLMQEWIAVSHQARHIRWPMLIQGMSQADFFVMHQIYHHMHEHPEVPGIYASEIAARGHVSRAAVSRQLQQLENRGWIARCTDPNSKRNAFVYLTDEGNAVVQRQHKIGEEFFDRVFARVGEERMQEAMSLIREIISAMEAELQKNGKEKGECK